jgi:hypothetical protein
MNGSIFHDPCPLAAWAMHRIDLPTRFGIPMHYCTITTTA